MCPAEDDPDEVPSQLKAELAEATALAEAAAARCADLEQQLRALGDELATLQPVEEVVDVQSVVTAEAKAAAAEAELEALR